MNAYERIMSEVKEWCKRCKATPLITDKDKRTEICFRCRQFEEMKRINQEGVANKA